MVKVGHALIAQAAVLRLETYLRLANVAELILNNVLVVGPVKLARLQLGLVLHQHIVVDWVHADRYHVEDEMHQVDGQVEHYHWQGDAQAGKVRYKQSKVDQTEQNVQRPADYLEVVYWPSPAIVAHVVEWFFGTRFGVHLDGH